MKLISMRESTLKCASEILSFAEAIGGEAVVSKIFFGIYK